MSIALNIVIQVNNFKEKDAKVFVLPCSSLKKVPGALKGEGTQRFLREGGEI